MKTILIVISFVGLVLTLLPAFLVFENAIAWETYITLMNIGTMVWFLTAPFWIKKEDEV
jgi:hypothetical protein